MECVYEDKERKEFFDKIDLNKISSRYVRLLFCILSTGKDLDYCINLSPVQAIPTGDKSTWELWQQKYLNELGSYVANDRGRIGKRYFFASRGKDEKQTYRIICQRLWTYVKDLGYSNSDIRKMFGSEHKEVQQENFTLKDVQSLFKAIMAERYGVDEQSSELLLQNQKQHE